MIARLVVLAEVGGGVEDHIAPGERRRERLGVAHVADDPGGACAIEQAARFGVGANQADDFVTFAAERANEIVS